MDQNIDPERIAALIEQRAWVPLASIVIWLALRLFKSDTKLPTIPPRVRIWVVFGLGVASGVLEHVIKGKSWTDALTGAALSVLLALMFHEGFIESIRQGKDIALPGLIVPGVAPSPTAPVTKPVEAPLPPPAGGFGAPPPIHLMPLPGDTPPSESIRAAEPSPPSGTQRTHDRPPNNVD